MNNFTKYTTRKNVFRAYVDALNGMIDVTEKTLVTLSYILDMYYDELKVEPRTGILDLDGRKALAKALRTGVNNTWVILRSLKSKGLLSYDKEFDNFIIHKALIPIIQDGKITINITLNIDESV